MVLFRGGRQRHLCRFLHDLPSLIAGHTIFLLILYLQLLYLREQADFVYLCLKRLIGDRNMELLIGPIERAQILLRIVQFVLLIDCLKSQDYLVCVVLNGLDNCIAHDLEQLSRRRVRSIGLMIRCHSYNLMVHAAIPGQRGAVEIFRLVLHASLLRVDSGQDQGVALCVLLQVDCHRSTAAQHYRVH